MTAKHTPIPWRNPAGSVSVFAGREKICDMAWFNKTTDAAEANAEFAVRAVNCHADLLEACKAMLMDSGCPIGHQKADRWAKACDLAREALRKAEGEEGV